MLNVCDVCGYDYRGSGDSAHACGGEHKFWGFGSRQAFDEFVKKGGINTNHKTMIIGHTGPELNYGPIKAPSTIQKQNIDSFLKDLANISKIGSDAIVKIAEKEKIDPSNASRFDSGKVDWSQVPFQALEGMVRVLEFGAKKYSKGNWASGGGFDHSRVFNSLMRHLVAYQSGQDLDEESGLPHIDHVMCNSMFMAYYIKFPDLFPKDDRINWGRGTY